MASSSPASDHDDGGGGGGGASAVGDSREPACPPGSAEKFGSVPTGGGESRTFGEERTDGGGPAVNEEKRTKTVRLDPSPARMEEAALEKAAEAKPAGPTTGSTKGGPSTEGGRARLDKAAEIVDCLAGRAQPPFDGATMTADTAGGSFHGSDVDLWRLRSLALSPGGLLRPELRRRAWPTLLSVQSLLLRTAGTSMDDLLSGDIEGVEVMPLPEDDAARMRSEVTRRGGSVWHVERHIRRNREKGGEATGGGGRGNASSTKAGGRTRINRRRAAASAARAAPQSALSPGARRASAPVVRKRVQIVPHPPPSPIRASPSSSMDDGSASPPTPLVQYHSGSSNGSSGGGSNGKGSRPSPGQNWRGRSKSALLPPSIRSDRRAWTRSSEEREVLLSVITSVLRSPPPATSQAIRNGKEGLPSDDSFSLGDTVTGPKQPTGDRDRLHYYSGLHDLAALLLVQLESPSLTSLALRRLSENHLRDAMRSSDVPGLGLAETTSPGMEGAGNGSGSIRPVDAAVRIALPPLLKEADAELHDAFFSSKDHAGRSRSRWISALASRWMSTWFVKDVPDSDIAGRLVDALLVGHPLMPLYFTVAMLTQPSNRERILACLGEESSSPQSDGRLKTLLENLPRDTFLPRDDESDSSWGGRADSHDAYLDLLEWRSMNLEEAPEEEEVDQGKKEGENTSSGGDSSSKESEDNFAASPQDIPRHLRPSTREDELSSLLAPTDSLIARATALLSSVPPPTLLRLARIYHHDHRRRRNHAGGDDRRSLLPYLHAMDDDDEKRSFSPLLFKRRGSARRASSSSDGRRLHALSALACPPNVAWAVSPLVATDWEALRRMAALRQERHSAAATSSSPSKGSPSFDPASPARRSCKQLVAEARRYSAAMDAAGFDPEGGGGSGGWLASGRRRRKMVILYGSALAVGGAAAAAAVIFSSNGEGTLALSARSMGEGAMKMLVNAGGVAARGGSQSETTPTLRGEAQEVPAMQSSTENSGINVSLFPTSDAEEADASTDAKEDAAHDELMAGESGGSHPYTLLPGLSLSLVDSQQQRVVRASSGQVSDDALVGSGLQPRLQGQGQTLEEDMLINHTIVVSRVDQDADDIDVAPADKEDEETAYAKLVGKETLQSHERLSISSSPISQPKTEVLLSTIRPSESSMPSRQENDEDKNGSFNAIKSKSVLGNSIEESSILASFDRATDDHISSDGTIDRCDVSSFLMQPSPDRFTTGIDFLRSSGPSANPDEAASGLEVNLSLGGSIHSFRSTSMQADVHHDKALFDDNLVETSALKTTNVIRLFNESENEEYRGSECSSYQGDPAEESASEGPLIEVHHEIGYGEVDTKSSKSSQYLDKEEREEHGHVLSSRKGNGANRGLEPVDSSSTSVSAQSLLTGWIPPVSYCSDDDSSLCSSSSPPEVCQAAIKPPLAKLHRIAFAERSSAYAMMPKENIKPKAAPPVGSVDDVVGNHLLSQSVSEWNLKHGSKQRKGHGRVRHALTEVLKGATFTSYYK